MILTSLISAQAQTTYKKRILIYGPTLHLGIPPSEEDQFINNHPDEFEPVQTGTPGKSAIWDDQQWVNATLADFQQFDAIFFSDQANPTPNWAGALATRAIWGSAINGNIFVTSGDPVNDGAHRVFRQGLRFAAAQAGNAHGRTGLYVALDHTLHGENLGNLENPTEIPILSWFGSFRAVALSGNTTPTRLIVQNQFLNVLGADVVNYSGSTGQGFHSWPVGFVAVAIRMTDSFPTPKTVLYTPCEADTGYEYQLGGHCAAPGALVYMLAKAVNPYDTTWLVPQQCNVAVNVGQACNFTAWSTLTGTVVPDPNAPNGPSTQVSWRVVTGPNAGQHGKCVRKDKDAPLGLWNASYYFQGTLDPNNSLDVVQLFLDYPQNGVPPDAFFNDMSNSASATDPDDPAPGKTIEYGTTFTVNWGVPQLSVAKMATPAAAAEPATSAFFRVSRTGSTTAPLSFSACLSGTAFAPCEGMTTFDYGVRVNNVIIPLNADCGFTANIPANVAYLDVEIRPVDDTEAEGPETVRIALKDFFDGTFVVGGNGFAELTINDNDQPVVTVTKTLDGSEIEPITSGAWTIQTGSPIATDLKVYFKLSGTANNEVDYHTSLVSDGVADDNDLNDNIILPSGTCRVTLHPNSGPGGIGQTSISLIPFQDSRTEGTESATATLITHPAYKLGSPAAASVNITDNDTPQIPANGYTITELGNVSHPVTSGFALNNLSSPTVAGDFLNVQGILHAYSWTAGAFTDLPPIPQLGPTATEYLGANAVNDSGWVVGAGRSELSASIYQHYYYLWNGSTMLQLQTPAGADLDNGPQSINAAGFSVGAMRDTFGFFKVAWWNPNTGNFTALGSLGSGLSALGFAWAIGPSQIAAQPANRVAGLAQFDLGFSAVTPAFHAFRTQAGATPQTVSTLTDDLGNFLASDTSYSGAYAINNLSEIAGYTATSATESRAAYKDGNSGKNKGWRTLGVLTGGVGAGQSCHAFGINNVGLIVGWSRTTMTGTGNPKAVVWENYQTSVANDLNLNIPVADRPNWLLQSAYAINNNGRIVGVGLKNGQKRAFLLTPIP